jgi:hypothetical protein
MVLNTAVRQKDFGINYSTIPNPADTYLTLQDAITGQDGHTTVQVIRDGIVQNVVAYLTSGSTAEWVSGAYAKATTLHYTDPAKLVSGTYVAGADVAAGVVPPASPWLLSALDGKDGVSAVSTITTTRPNVPAVGSDATYSVGSAAGYGIGVYVDIVNASSASLGTFLIVGITTTSLTLRNVTAIATTTVSTGFTVVASGKPGTNGINGTSAIATASAFTQPAVNANVNVTVNSSVGFVDKQPLFHNLGGYYKVSGAPSSATTVTLQNLGYAGNIAAAASVGAGTLVPSGLKGADASGSGHTIQEEGVSLTQRSKLNFVGASATATDDAANDATVITLTSSGGATGIKYTLNTAAGTPTAGEIRSTDLSLGGTIAISATDAATPSKSAADILARIKVGAIIEIAESSTKRIRATVTTDYTVGSGSFAVSTPLVDGAIGNGAIVFLSIASDALAIGAGEADWNESISATLTLTANTGYISNTTGRQILTLPTAQVGKWLAVVGKGAGGYQIIGGTFLFADGTSNNGLRNTLGTHRYASVKLRCIDAASSLWLVEYPSDKTGLEVFSYTAGLLPETTAIVSEMAVQGYTATGAQQTAINDFLTATATLRSAVAREYGLIGGTANSHKIDWKTPGANALTYTGTVTHSSVGAVTAASSSLNSGFNIPIANKDNFAIGVYLTAAVVGSFFCGSTRFGDGYSMQTSSSMAMGTGMSLSISAKGFAGVSRTASNVTHARYNATTVTGTGASTDPGGYFDASPSQILFGAETNNGGVSGSGNSIGHGVIFNRGLTPTELQTYGNAVIALQTALGRN